MKFDETLALKILKKILARFCVLWPCLYISLLTSAIYFFFQDWAYDDPFILFRYARNLLAGKGFVYNESSPVLSATAPLYVLLVAFLGRFWSNLPELSNFLSAFSLAVGGYFLARICHLWKGGLAGWIALLLYPTFPLMLTTIGGEMPFQIMASLGVFLWYMQRRYLLASLFGAVALLTRPDASILLGLLALHHLFRRRERVPLPSLLLFALITIPWFTFAWWYFGSPIPVTLEVKQHHLQMAGGQSFASGFIGVVRNFGLFPIYWIEATLAMVGVAYIVTRRRQWILFLLWPTLYFIAYVLLGLPAYHWYYTTFVPGFVAILVLGIQFLAASWLRLSKNFWLLSAVWLGVSVLTASQIWHDLTVLPTTENRKVVQAVGEWLSKHTPSEAVVGTLEVGIIGYYSERKMVGFAGLIQPHLVRQLRSGTTTYEDLAMWATERYKPNYLVLNPAQFPGFMKDYVAKNCEPVQTFNGEEYEYRGRLVVFVCNSPQGPLMEISLRSGLTARGKSPAGRVASAVVPDARRADRGDAGSSSRRRYTADGSTPPQPKGRQGFAAAGRRYSSSPMSRHRLLLVSCQRPQIPGARPHATFTTGC